MKFALLSVAAGAVLSAQLVSAAPSRAETLLAKRVFDSSTTNTNTVNTQANNNSDHNGYNANQAANYKKGTNNSNSGNSKVGDVWGGGNSQGPQTISCKRDISHAQHIAQVEYVKRKFDLALNKMDWSMGSGGDDEGTTQGSKNVHIDDHSTNNSGNTSNLDDESNVQNFSGANNIVGAGIRCSGKVRRALDLERRHLSLGDGIIQSFGLVARSEIPMTDALAVREIGLLAEELGVRGVVDKGAPSPLRRWSPDIICTSANCNEVARRSADDLLRMHARSIGFVM